MSGIIGLGRVRLRKDNSVGLAPTVPLPPSSPARRAVESAREIAKK